MLGVPLLRGDAVIGVITLTRNVVRPFTDKQIELVTTFADQAVIAIENVRLFDEVQARTRELTEALEQQTATSAILRVISTSPTDVQPVFETIVRNAVALCGSLFANVFRFDGELLHLVASHNVGPDYVELLRAKYPMRPNSSRYPDEPSSPGRWSDWRTRWPIRTTISDFPRPWAGAACWVCRCCAKASRSASSSSAGPRLDPCRRPRKSC